MTIAVSFPSFDGLPNYFPNHPYKVAMKLNQVSTARVEHNDLSGALVPHQVTSSANAALCDNSYGVNASLTDFSCTG